MYRSTWWASDQPIRPMAVMARMMARERRMLFQRKWLSSAYICGREGRRLNMVDDKVNSVYIGYLVLGPFFSEIKRRDDNNAKE